MTEPQPKRRRRWFQFSLRTLMLFTAVCTIPSAWVGWKLDETRREQVVVVEIEKLGGGVLHHELKGPDWLAWRFRKVQVLGLIDTQVTDEGVEELQQALPNCDIRH
jgi:hypothetical protein